MSSEQIPLFCDHHNAQHDHPFNGKTVENESPLASLYSIFSTIEMPLLPVLIAMELRGVSINCEHLHMLRKRIESDMDLLKEKIYDLAGEVFSINSTKQLANILYNKLRIRPGRKTKLGYSTDAATLNKLRGTHEIIDVLLEYRHMEKLLTTYVVPLPTLVHTHTGRVHTSFNQAVVTTGRLSSSNPNLQNIPIRTTLGQEIRKAFCAAPGYSLVCLDYSQVELRIMAHCSGDERMIKDFQQGRDIHSATARRIFGASCEDVVTQQERSIAKAMNFALLYGAGPQKIAENARIPLQKAKEFTQEYFRQYPGVAKHIEFLKERARQTGYAQTLLGRWLPLPDIRSNYPHHRAMAERIAVNMPIQGTAADIIKKAMIETHLWTKKQRYDVHLLLQVHDELVLEVEEGYENEASMSVREIMESIFELSVPLAVEVTEGKNWSDAKMKTKKTPPASSRGV